MNDTPDPTGIDQAIPTSLSNDQMRGLIQQRDLWRNVQINRGMDGDADQAAQSVDLSAATGVPAALINDNHEEFVDSQKKQAAQGIVSQNSDLEDYVMSHPLATTISNDDWANLDKFTKESSAPWFKALVRPETIDTLGATASGAIEGAKEGFAGADLWGDDQNIARAEDPSLNKMGPLGAAVAKGFYGGTNLLYKAMAGAMEGAGGAAEGFGTSVGGPQLGRELRAMTEYEFTRGDKPLHGPEIAGPKPPELGPPKAMDVARPYFEAGQEPPTGLHPEIDAQKAAINAQYVERMEQDLANAASSTTRERSGEMFSALTQKMYGDSTIGLHADAALALYPEGKLPEADDGILGWVPDLQKQLDEAREIGSDITIPMADWMAKVDLAVSKQLTDDIRMWPGGVTAREATLSPPEARGIVDEALPTVRAAGALEPKFSIGDRKLTLMPAERQAEFGLAGVPAHVFDIHDENGQPVGNMELTPGADGKTLYVNWIGGQAGMWANSFGPGLVRDIKRQLKTMYPDFEYLTGHRVSGARYGEAAAERDTPMELPRVRLSAPSGWDVAGGFSDNEGDWQRSQDIFQNGWQRFSERMDVNRQAPGFYTQEQMAMGQATYDEIRRLTGGKVNPEMAAGIRGTGRGMDTANTVRGMYAPAYDTPPDIVVDLLGPDPMGTGRHESVHFLRDYGLITKDEWDTLAAAAHSEGWLDRYDIHNRYPGASDDLKTEEGVVEGFREWASKPENERAKGGVSAVFQKIWDFLDRVRQGMGKYLGREVTFEDIFKRINRGEVGAREAQAPEHPDQFRFSVEDQREANIEGLTNLQAASVGMPVPAFKRLQEAIRERGRQDLAKAQARAEKEQTKRQTSEWKDNRAAMVDEVSKDIHQRPDVAADLFIGSGELYGTKTRQRYTLAADSLTPEQKAMLPDHYVSAKGLDPDSVAGLFGYSSGTELVNALSTVDRAKMKPDGTRMRPSEYVRGLVQGETDRRMELRYGNLQANILDDAKDQALSDSSLNVMHEELTAAATAAGTTTFDKATIRAAAQRLINETTLGKLNSFRLQQAMGQHGRNAEAALIKGDYAGATVHMQRQTVTAWVAKMAKDIEGDVAKFNKDAARWGKYRTGSEKSSLPNEYATVVQQLLTQMGKKVGVTPEWLAREYGEAGIGSTQKFVDGKVAEGNVIAPFEAMLDKGWKKDFKDLTTEEFGQANDFIRQLVKAGRDEKKAYAAGEAYDWENEVKPKLLSGLERLADAGTGVASKVGHTVGSLLIQMETYVDRLDQWDPTATWNKFFLRPLFDTEHVEMDRVREVTKDLRELVGLKFGNQEIPSIFENPRNGEKIVATRETLWAAMLNQGSRDNREAFAKAWGKDPGEVKAWIDSMAGAEDWHGVQRIWDLFKQAGDWSNEEYRRIGGRAMKWIEPEPVDTPHGQFPGGYYPIMHHPDFPGKSANLLGLSDKGLFGGGYSTGFAPGAGYREARTGYVAPMALDLKQVANRLLQQIHDGAMRGSLRDTAKILRDPDIKDAMIEKLGHEVYDGMVQHLRRIANKQSPDSATSRAQMNVSGVGDYIRRNVVSNMIGLNLGTIEKHGPTALGTSFAQLGVGGMMDAYRDFWMGDKESGAALKVTVDNKSALMRARQRDWMENIFGNVQQIHDDKSAMSVAMRFRDWGQWAATKPVAISDAISAYPLWWGTYKAAKSAGQDEGAAVYMADKAVRKAHGAGGEVGQPLVMSSVSRWFTPMYNFYNSVLNKAVESSWRAGEAQRAWTEGDYTRMQAHMKKAAMGGFVALVLPSIIHDIISPPKINPDDPWEYRILKYIAGPIASFVPGGGNAVEYLTGGSTPDVGIMTGAFKQAFDLPRDFLEMMHGHRQGSPVAHNEKLIRDAGTFMGFLGLPAGRMLGNWASAAYGYAKGQERPQNVHDLHDMARFGTMHHAK